MRESFIFYKSFVDAGSTIENKNERLAYYEAIFQFAINGEESELKGVAKGMFSLVKPQLQANQKRWENGTKGGKKAIPNPNQNLTEIEPKPNQDETKTEANNNVECSNVECINENEKIETKGFFYRIGNNTVIEKISAYFKRTNQVTMEAMLMQFKISETEGLQRLDDGFPPGYHFKDNNHLINSFRTVLKDKPVVTSAQTVTTAKKDTITSNFAN